MIEDILRNKAIYFNFQNMTVLCDSNAGFSWSQVILSRKKTKKTLVVIDYGNTLYFHVLNGIDT